MAVILFRQICLMPTLLALEASTERCSVALCSEGIFYERHSLLVNQHNQQILPMIDEVLQASGKVLSDIDAFAFGCGPGSFTGIRIATAVVQALAFSCNKPVIAVSSLAALAQSAFQTKGLQNVLTVVDARMGEVYCAFYRLNEMGLMSLHGLERVCKPEHISELLPADDLIYAVGNGCCYQQEIQCSNPRIQSWQNDCFVSAREVIVLANAAYAKGEYVQAEQAQPVYLREQISWKKLPGR